MTRKSPTTPAEQERFVSALTSQPHYTLVEGTAYAEIEADRDGIRTVCRLYPDTIVDHRGARWQVGKRVIRRIREYFHATGRARKAA